MAYSPWSSLLVLHCLFFAISLALRFGADVKALTVGDEIKEESLPLNMGQRIYELQGLKDSTWYEVKISYPASIPARFSIQLETGAPELGLSKNRRLLNTEKLIFKADDRKPVNVVVTVEAEGVVAKPNVKERELVVFNIVCDELMLGIPHDAWWVGIAGLLCLVLALVIPSFLPHHLLPKNAKLAIKWCGCSKGFMIYHKHAIFAH